MLDDNELMELAQNGDKQAFEVLVLKHRLQAVNFANSIVLSYHTAEDIVQECFAKLYINIQSYKPSNKFKAYFYTVIRNKCIDTLRKAKLTVEADIDSFIYLTDDVTPDDLLIKKESQKKVADIFSSLQGDYKTALYLFAVEEMSYKETARVMQKTVPQIKLIIYRGRQKLKKLNKGADSNEK